VDVRQHRTPDRDGACCLHTPAGADDARGRATKRGGRWRHTGRALKRLAGHLSLGTADKHRHEIGLTATNRLEGLRGRLLRRNDQIGVHRQTITEACHPASLHRVRPA
jgi:hypothetical protein